MYNFKRFVMFFCLLVLLFGLLSVSKPNMMVEARHNGHDDICWHCNGTGRCPECNGEGTITIFGGPMEEDDYPTENVTTCRECYGSGQCNVCYGSGFE